MTIYLELSDPTVRKLVNVAFPGYTGRRVQCQVRDSVAFYGTQWDGGEKRDYKIVRLADLASVPIPEQPYGADSPAHRESMPIPEGCVVVCHNQGRYEHISIFAPKEVINPLLPAPVSLTDDEKIVLEYTCKLKASYAGISNFRFVEANRTTKISAERWNSAKESLTASGYLDKRGAVTVKGRNARL